MIVNSMGVHIVQTVRLFWYHSPPPPIFPTIAQVSAHVQSFNSILFTLLPLPKQQASFAKILRASTNYKQYQIMDLYDLVGTNKDKE